MVLRSALTDSVEIHFVDQSSRSETRTRGSHWTFNSGVSTYTEQKDRSALGLTVSGQAWGLRLQTAEKMASIRFGFHLVQSPRVLRILSRIT